MCFSGAYIYCQLSGQIPENICTLYSNNENAKLWLDSNQLCPPYPECLTEKEIGIQNTSMCGE